MTVKGYFGEIDAANAAVRVLKNAGFNGTAASSMVNGMGTFDEITNINYVVTVNASDNQKKEAKNIMKNMGGYLENPNVNREKSISDAEIDIKKAASKVGLELK